MTRAWIVIPTYNEAENLPSLAAAVRAAMAGRHVPGGGVDGWAWDRQLLSRAGGFYARAVLGSSIRDLTGGFKCFVQSRCARSVSTPSRRTAQRRSCRSRSARPSEQARQTLGERTGAKAELPLRLGRDLRLLGP